MREAALDQRLVALQLPAIRDGVLARQHPAPLKVLDLVQVHASAGHPRAQDRNQHGLRFRRQPLGEKRFQPGRLILLNVDEKQIRRVLADLQRELVRADSPAVRGPP